MPDKPTEKPLANPPSMLASLPGSDVRITFENITLIGTPALTAIAGVSDLTLINVGMSDVGVGVNVPDQGLLDARRWIFRGGRAVITGDDAILRIRESWLDSRSLHERISLEAELRVLAQIKAILEDRYGVLDLDVRPVLRSDHRVSKRRARRKRR